MKTFFHHICIFFYSFLLLGTSACSESFLKDMENYGSYGNETFNSETMVTDYVNTLYARAFRGYNTPSQTLLGLWVDRNNLTTEKWGMNEWIDPTVIHYTSAFDATNLVNYFGSALGTSAVNTPYTRIRNGNLLLEELKTSTISETAKNYARGQALCLRAMQLFDLVRTYGSVPIVTKVLNASVAGKDEQLPRASVTKCVEQIIRDLDEASSLLPLDWAASEYGRLTSGAALALKSRVLLTYASPIFNRDWDNPDNKRWELALEATLAAQNALTSNGLDGCNNAKEWANMLASANNSFHKEAIIVKLLTDVQGSDNEYNGWERALRMPSQEGLNGYAAPVEIIDAFPMADGKRPSDKVKIAKGSKSFFLDRDPRFYRTFAFNGVKWGYNGHPDDVVWGYRWQASKLAYGYSDQNQIASPAFVRKMSSIETSPTENFAYSSTDIYEYRYAELILNLAECYAATGHPNEAVKWLGEIRKRVGIPAGEDGTYGIGILTDRHQALEACLYERQIELAYEGKRFWDVWRWLLYDGGQGEGLKLSDVNTCTALGIPPLNGTHRTSLYVDVLPSNYTIGEKDPLLSKRSDMMADPNAENFKEQLIKLQHFWEECFCYGKPDIPADRDKNNNPINIFWQANYYIHGLGSIALNNNPWLGQTLGWKDQNGVNGTIGWQDDEELQTE